jgi:hypothetical protein
LGYTHGRNLRAEFDFGVLQNRAHRVQRRVRRADDDFNILDPGHFLLQRADERERDQRGFVHLPVAGNDGFA